MQLRSLIFAGIITAAVAFGQDPPSRVARLNWITGDVSFQPAGIDAWTAASLNYPLTTGDHIYTDLGARAEMHIGPNAFRLNGQSNFGFLNLDDNTVQVRFTGGSLEIRLKQLDDQDVYEIDTPQGAISLLRTGDYRIDTDPDRNATMVTVRGGAAEITEGGITFSIHARQTAWFADGSQPDIRDANPFDDFDRFTADRNAREDRIPAPIHVSSDMVGYEDLDANGVWSDDPGYGWVWAPRVEVGWVPYHNGRWAWVEPWGWTWIDEARWGFAPFHYGRWASLGGTWVWVPGSVAARPVYAPALVVFAGGPRFRIGIGIGIDSGPIGAVAWFPLGPREPYIPTYRVSSTYIRQVNITHVTNVNITNIRYSNQQVPGAVTAIPQDAFTGSHPVARAAQNVSPAQAAQAQIVGTAPAIAPIRQSVMATGRVNARVAQPSDTMTSRQVVAKTTPPPAPVRFEARQQMLEQNQGRPLAPEQVSQIRRQPDSVVNRAQVRGAVPPPGQPIPSPPVFNPPVSNQRAMPDTPRPSIRNPNPPVNRMDSAPPAAPQFSQPPVENRPAPVERPQVRPAPQIAPRPVPESRPVPEFRPRPEPQPAPQPAPQAAPRPVPEGRSIPAPAAAPAPRVERAPAPAERKAEPKVEEKKADKP